MDPLEAVQGHDSVIREIQGYLSRGVTPVGYAAFDIAEAREKLNTPESPIPEDKIDDYDFVASKVQGALSLVTFRDEREIRTKEGGIYSKEGESYIRSLLEKWMPAAHKRVKDETIEKLKDRTILDQAEFISPPSLVAFDNKVFDVTSGEFRDYQDTDKLLSKFEVKIDPKLTLPVAAIRFLEAAQPNPDFRRRLWDHFASCLDRRPLKRRALMLEGEPDTGKSTFLGLERAFLGAENVSNLSLQDICYSPWAGAQVYDKALNYHGDLADAQLKELGKFKTITGGDALTVQRKHGQLFEVVPYVKLHFAANALPSLRDTTDEAFFSRWDIVTWPVRVRGAAKDAKLLERMSAPDELSALAWVLCGIVKRQFTKGFVFEPSPEEVRDTWLGKVEPVRIWLKSHAKRNVNAWVQRSDLFNAWESYRLANDLSKVTETRFVELVGQVVGGEKASIKQKGKTLRVYRNIESDIPGVIQASTVTQVTGFSDLLSIVENSIGEKYPQKAVTPVTENQKGAEP